MPLVKTIRRRGARVTVEAHGEVLFTPTGAVGVWAASLSRAITAATKEAAPTNKRPYWGHYAGVKRLKQSFTTTTAYDPATMTVRSAIGSSAAYALYVDKGTGIYAGRKPYPAAILPPWRRGEASLYESSWRPSGVGGPTVKRVMIKGQKGQEFFRKGIRFGMLSRGVVPVTVPGDPSGGLRNQQAQVLPNLTPPPMPLFRLQLEEWRIWRDKAWDAGDSLGRDGGASSRWARRRAAAAKASASKPKSKAAAPKKPTTKPKQATKKTNTTPKNQTKRPPKPTRNTLTAAQIAQHRQGLTAFLSQNGRFPVRAVVIKANGQWTASVNIQGVWRARSGQIKV